MRWLQFDRQTPRWVGLLLVGYVLLGIGGHGHISGWRGVVGGLGALLILAVMVAFVVWVAASIRELRQQARR